MDDALRQGMAGECPECSRELNGDETFCPGCGCDLASFNPSNCPACEYDLTGDERYCPGCGHDLDNEAASTTAVSTGGTDRRGVLKYGAGFMSAAALAGGGWWLTNGNSPFDAFSGLLGATQETPTTTPTFGDDTDTDPPTSTPTPSPEASTPSASPELAVPPLAARYTFEGTGSTIEDVTGNGYDGELENASRATGYDGQSLHFEEANQEWATFGGADELSPRDGSIAVE